MLKEMRTTLDFIESYNMGFHSSDETDFATDDKSEDSGKSDVSDTEEEPDDDSCVLDAEVDGNEDDIAASAGQHRETRSQRIERREP